MVSMKDIAAKCGVSVATVSKALNGQKDIGELTRNKVMKTAEEMGYMANAAARALKTNRTYNIGVLLTDENRSGLTHHYFSALLESVKTESERLGYDITFINQNVGDKETTYLQHCRYRGVDGVIIANMKFDNPQIIELINSDIPVVVIDHVFNNRTSILSDNVAGMRSLVTYLHELGHRRMALLHGEKASSVTNYRVTSFYKTCYELGIEVDENRVLQSRYADPDKCSRLVKELLAMKNPPTAIFCPDDVSAIGALNAIHELGLSVPEDVSVVGYDGNQISQVITPHLTTYKQDTKSLGIEAARQLVNLIEQPKLTIPEQIFIPGELIKGDSSAPPKD